MEERGGLNTFAFLGGDPVNNIDYLGLAGGIDLRAVLYQKLDELELDLGGGEIGKISGLPRFLELERRMLVIYPRVVEGGLTRRDAEAEFQYNPIKGGSFHLRTANPTYASVAHELVHAFNRYYQSGTADLKRVDEGMAHAAEKLILSPLKRGVGFERFITESDTETIKKRLTSTTQWRDLWEKSGNVAKFGNIENDGDADKELKDPYRADDFNNLRWSLYLHVSCDEFAEVLNKLLADKGVCIRLTCNKTAGPEPCEIPAGVDIDEVFRH